MNRQVKAHQIFLLQNRKLWCTDLNKVAIRIEESDDFLPPGMGHEAVDVFDVIRGVIKFFCKSSMSDYSKYNSEALFLGMISVSMKSDHMEAS